jgi:hypothetical protein
MAAVPVKLLSGLSWVLIFALYFSAELILRVYYVHGEGNSKEQMESWTNKLPAFITDSLKSQQRAEETRKELDTQLKGDDKKKIIAAYYQHGYELDENERDILFKELVEKYPDDYECHTAVITLLSENDNTYNLDYVIKYADQFKAGEQKKIFSAAWPKTKSFKLASQEIYLKELLKRKYISADFFYIYEELQSLIFKLKLPTEFDDQLDNLKSQCLIKLKEENAQLKNEKGKVKGKGK